MRFFVRKRRQTPTVIIVALIDVLIVLLIFLVVTTTFKHQPSLRLALPESTQAQKSGANETPPYVVTVDKQGNLQFGLGTESRPVTADRLREELLALAAKSPEVRLAISADKEAPFGQIVKVIDATKEAKIKTVNAFMKEAAK